MNSKFDLLKRDFNEENKYINMFFFSRIKDSKDS